MSFMFGVSLEIFTNIKKIVKKSLSMPLFYTRMGLKVVESGVKWQKVEEHFERQVIVHVYG
ncbi:MAG: hypothetical protein KH128_05150 [Firmicutes bacterium]|nr:hypothetical protein [Bacillota bacterium]